MKRSKIYEHLSNLSALVEDINDDVSPIVKTTESLISVVIKTHLGVGTPVKLNTMNKQKNNEKDVIDTKSDLTIDLDNMTNEQQLNAAYEILANESKPGPTYLAKAASIPIAKAKSLYTKLKKEGMIGSSNSLKPSITKEPTFMDIINELPNGSDLLVKSPFNVFIALEEGVRAKYLTGLNLEDLITPQAIATATEQGANKLLIEQIDSLKGKKKPKVNHVITAMAEKGNQMGADYIKRIKSWLKDIPDGRLLYKHMKIGGVNKATLRDIRDIADACKKGNV